LNMGVLVLGAGLFALSSARGLLSVIALPTLVVIVSPLLFVSLSTITNRVTDSHHRATVLSTQSLITRFGVAAVVPLFGHGVEPAASGCKRMCSRSGTQGNSQRNRIVMVNPWLP
jgi:hypothetical protein